jgi:hypothetical protein
MKRELQREVRDERDIRNALAWADALIRRGLHAGPVRLSLGRPRRSLDQNAKFHAICSDVAKQAQYMGKRLTPAQWKVLFISGHAMATGIGAEVVPGLEGEFVNIRESSAKMSKCRMTSLIEYVMAWCAENSIEINLPEQDDMRKYHCVG